MVLVAPAEVPLFSVPTAMLRLPAALIRPPLLDRVEAVTARFRPAWMTPETPSCVVVSVRVTVGSVMSGVILPADAAPTVEGSSPKCHSSIDWLDGPLSPPPELGM